jgi:transcriptional regulator with XRE-family HTH domain
MAPNIALRQARVRAHLSQDDLARRIREAGFRTGDSNACTRGMVQRWESGRVLRPQGRYLLALENVLGQPAASLGFADDAVGLDRGRALADAGLDTVMPLPEPGANYGPLSGIWLSTYEYPSTGRDGVFTGRHYALVLQRGAHLMVRSLPASASRLSMEMDVNGQVATGTWTEQTAEGGYYRGAVYHGAVQMLTEPTGRRMAGKWVGFGRDLEVNVGSWKLELIEDSLADEVIEKWNRPTDDNG